MAIRIVIPRVIPTIPPVALSAIDNVTVLMASTVALGNPGAGFQVDETVTFGVPGVVQIPGVLFDLAIGVLVLQNLFLALTIQRMHGPDHVPRHTLAKGMVAAHVAHINGLIVR